MSAAPVQFARMSATQRKSKEPASGTKTKTRGKSGKKPDKKPKVVSKEAPEEFGSFEGALDQLEKTVSRLESGEMPLEEALELFEAGVKLTRQCSETLEAAEKRIEILAGDRGGKAEPFAFDDDFDEDEFEDDDAASDDSL